MFGKPETVVPRYASGGSPQTSFSSRPSRPWTSIGATKSCDWKPVPQMIVSAARSTPSAPTTPVGGDPLDPPVTSSTLSRRSAGYQSLVNRTRLQPIS